MVVINGAVVVQKVDIPMAGNLDDLIWRDSLVAQGLNQSLPGTERQLAFNMSLLTLYSIETSVSAVSSRYCFIENIVEIMEHLLMF